MDSNKKNKKGLFKSHLKWMTPLENFQTKLKCYVKSKGFRWDIRHKMSVTIFQMQMEPESCPSTFSIFCSFSPIFFQRQTSPNWFPFKWPNGTNDNIPQTTAHQNTTFMAETLHFVQNLNSSPLNLITFQMAKVTWNTMSDHHSLSHFILRCASTPSPYFNTTALAIILMICVIMYSEYWILRCGLSNISANKLATNTHPAVLHTGSLRIT